MTNKHAVSPGEALAQFQGALAAMISASRRIQEIDWPDGLIGDEDMKSIEADLEKCALLVNCPGCGGEMLSEVAKKGHLRIFHSRACRNRFLGDDPDQRSDNVATLEEIADHLMNLLGGH